jgi:hypothetical protein
MEKPPRLLGILKVHNPPELKDKLFVCTGSVWDAGNKVVSALCHQLVEADKFECTTHDTYNGDGVSFEGLKVTYRDNDYVFTNEEFTFTALAEEQTPSEKKTRRSRKNKGTTGKPETVPNK